MQRVQDFLTVLSIFVLIGGCAYFIHLKLEIDHVNQANDRLKESFYAAPTTEQAPVRTATPVPEWADAEAVDGLQMLRLVHTVETEALARTNQAASFQALSFAQAAPVSEPVQEASAMAIAEDVVSPFNMPKAIDVPIERILQPAFEELHAQNPDLVGWIKLGDTVDFPVLWRDNEFYMDHDFYGAPSQAGAIFLDARNGAYMTDSAMLIYGHNMRNGAMFGDLDKYREQSYLCQYPIITLQSAWESEPRKYVLISLFDASMNKTDSTYIRIIRTSFEEDAEKEAFIAEMRSRSMYSIPIEAGAQDQLLTLVTCSYTHNNGRFLLFARELRADETEEQIMTSFQSMN